MTLAESSVNLITDYKFNGKELDAETGLYYYGARYYDPKSSIWLSVDPLATEAPGWTSYRYCFNNPINLIDKNGLIETDDIVYRLKGEDGKYKEVARIKTSQIERTIDVENASDIPFSIEPVVVDASDMDLSKVNAVSINFSLEVAVQGGAQVELNYLTIIRGMHADESGVFMQINGLSGVEGGFSGGASFYFRGELGRDLELGDFEGVELGVQASVGMLGVSGFRGVKEEFRSPIAYNLYNMPYLRSPIKETVIYSGFSISTGGSVLPASISGYAGYGFRVD